MVHNVRKEAVALWPEEKLSSGRIMMFRLASPSTMVSSMKDYLRIQVVGSVQCRASCCFKLDPEFSTHVAELRHYLFCCSDTH